MKNILKKLHEIMSKVDFIEKDKTNTFHGYKYASEQAIKETLHKLLVDHKVLFTLEALNFSSHHQPLEKEKDTITNIEFKYHFWDVESGEELSGNFVGSGEDKGDKGTYKAITGAVKYILTSTFLIPTGDDPENEDKKTNNQTAKGEDRIKPCDKCGKSIVKKSGKYGDFYACMGYPKCTRTFKPEDIDMWLEADSIMAG